jgi:pilus assembly protein Flp/PilA
MLDFIRTWFEAKRGERGQDLAEYALLIGLIALIVILAVTLLGNNISTIFNAIATNIEGWNIGT